VNCDFLDPAIAENAATPFAQNSAHMWIWSTTDNNNAGGRSNDMGA
jgi:hypothetical protein